MTDLRTYIAGLGSSGALVAAVVVAFVALGGIVAIKGLPESSRSASGGTVLVKADARGEGDRDVAAATAAGSAPRVDSGSASDGDRDSRGAGGAHSPGGTPQPVDPAFPPSEPPGLTPPGTEPPDSGPKPPSNSQPPSQDPKPPKPAPPKGPVGGLVEGVDGAAGDIGFHPGIAEAVVPITGPVDGVIGVITNPIPLPDAPLPTGADAGN